MNSKTLAVICIAASIALLGGCASPFNPNVGADISDNDLSYGGLTWTSPMSDTMTWDDANTYCANALINGQIDWRLPTREELQSARGRHTGNRQDERQGFEKLTREAVWSSTFLDLNSEHLNYFHYVSSEDERMGNAGSNSTRYSVICVRDIHTIRNREAEEQRAKEKEQQAKETAIARELKEAELAKQQARIDERNQSQETLIWFSDWEAKFSPSTEIGRRFNQILVDMQNADGRMRSNLSIASQMRMSNNINMINSSREYSSAGMMDQQNLTNITKQYVELWGRQSIDFRRQFKNTSETKIYTMLVPNAQESTPRPGYPLQKFNPFVRVYISQNKVFSIARITAYAPGEGIIMLYGK